MRLAPTEYFQSLPFFFKKTLLVASGLWRTLGFCRNFTAVVICKETNVLISHNAIMSREDGNVCRKNIQIH